MYSEGMITESKDSLIQVLPEKYKKGLSRKLEVSKPSINGNSEHSRNQQSSQNSSSRFGELIKASPKPVSHDLGGSYRKPTFSWHQQDQTVGPRASQRHRTSTERTGKSVSRPQLDLVRNTLKNIPTFKEKKKSNPA